MSGPTPDVELLREWVQEVYGDCTGYVEISWVYHGGMKSKPMRVRELLLDLLDEEGDARGFFNEYIQLTDLYLGCVTTHRVPAKGSRGKSSDRFEVPGIWLDLDFDGPGHKRREDGLPNFTGIDQALAVITEAGLPRPTHVISSGGGAYAWWLLKESLSVAPDYPWRQRVQALLVAVNQHVKTVAAARGIGMDKTSDTSRILRPPGSINWKLGAHAGRPVTWERELGSGDRYEAATLAGIDAIEQLLGAEQRTLESAETRQTVWDGKEQLFDACKAMTWAEILEPKGWSVFKEDVDIGRTDWSRPGRRFNDGDDTGGKSASVYHDRPEVLVVWSDAAGLPAGPGQKLTKFRVLSHLWFNDVRGDLTRHLITSVAIGKRGAPLPDNQGYWPRAVIAAAEHIMDLTDVMDSDWFQSQRGEH